MKAHSFCNIEELVEYVVCPAKRLISSTYERKPDKEMVRTRLHPLLNELILLSVGRIGLNLEYMDKSLELMFSDITYDNKDKDIRSTIDIVTNLDYMLKFNNYLITDPTNVFIETYGGIPIKSQYDMVVKDTVKDRMHPVVIDTSHTKYEPEYNPIVYRCQTVIDHMNIRNTNTELYVFSISSGKVWEFAKKKYNNLIKASIIETLTMMRNDLYPARFSWICAGCSYRGICHSLTKDRMTAITERK
jgi:hypothetical protein